MFDTLKKPISQAINSCKVKILNFYMQLKIKDFIPVIFLFILLLWIILVQFKINEDNFKQLIPDAENVQEAIDVYINIDGYPEKAQIEGIIFLFF